MPSTTGETEGLQREYEECMEEVAKWLVKHRKLIRARNLRPIQAKYFATHEERDKFNRYISSPEGGAEFVKILKLEGWKAGILGPER